jgi:hypothetical protein
MDLPADLDTLDTDERMAAQRFLAWPTPGRAQKRHRQQPPPRVVAHGRYPYDLLEEAALAAIVAYLRAHIGAVGGPMPAG